MRLRAVAERVAQQLPDRDRAFFEAYAKGVNAYINQHQNNLPMEFRILGYKPRIWTPADSLLIGIGMSQLLNPQYEIEYARERIGAKLSPELMADLYPPSSTRDHPPASEAGTGDCTGVAGQSRQTSKASACCAASYIVAFRTGFPCAVARTRLMRSLPARLE